MEKLTFLIADDHDLILKGIESLILFSFSGSGTEKVKSAEEAIEMLNQQSFDFLITDISMDGMDGVDLCRLVKNKHPETRIIVITQHKKIWIIKQLYSLKVDGLILKSDGIEELEHAINAILNNERYYTRSINDIILNYMVNQTQTSVGEIELTSREKDIIELIAQEYTTKEISKKLFISLKTVETHRKNLLVKFDVRNMVGLIKKAMELGFID